MLIEVIVLKAAIRSCGTLQAVKHLLEDEFLKAHWRIPLPLQDQPPPTWDNEDQEQAPGSIFSIRVR